MEGDTLCDEDGAVLNLRPTEGSAVPTRWFLPIPDRELPPCVIAAVLTLDCSCDCCLCDGPDVLLYISNTSEEEAEDGPNNLILSKVMSSGAPSSKIFSSRRAKI